MAPEAQITVNGQPLTNAQAMTLRVALTHFHAELGDDERREALGEIGPLYRDRAWEVLTLILRLDGRS